MTGPVENSVTGVLDCALVDPAAGTVRRNQHLLVSQGHITAVRRGGGAALQGEGTVDATGLYAVPGLIDMHVHMSADPDGSLLRDKGRYGATTLALLAARNLRVALEAGITTVRDLGTPATIAYEVRRAWRAGVVPLARPLVVGPAITAVGGHGAETGVQVRGAEKVAEEVSKRAGSRADGVKLVMASAARSVELTSAELRSGVTTAHEQGLPVAVHANFSEQSIRSALLAGCDTLEHGYVMGPGTVELMRCSGAALCPTLTALHAVAQHAEVFRERAGRELADTVLGSMEQAERTFREVLRAGIPVVAGTDAGVPFTRYDMLHDELAHMMAWGMTPVEALRAATSRAAEALRRPDLGGLRPGSVADVLLVRENPFEDLDTLRSPVAVLHRGECVVLREPQRMTDSRSTARCST